MKDRFDEFMKETFRNEGIFSNDPLDKGNAGKGTIFGISYRSFPKTYLIIKKLFDDGKVNLAKEQTMIFYRKEFYNPLYNEIDDLSLTFKLFDFGVNASKKKAIKILQKVINKYNKEDGGIFFAWTDPLPPFRIPYGRIKVDGIFGKITLENVNFFSKSYIRYFLSYDELIQGETELYTIYINILKKYYKSLWNFFRFGKGWLNRLKRIFN